MSSYIVLSVANLTAINPFMPNEISHRYQSEQYISVLRDVGVGGGDIFYIYSNFDRIFCKQTVETLVWVCNFCQRPTKRTLGLYGLRQIFNI